MQNVNEKRKYPRFRINIPVDCSGVCFLQTKHSHDLSLGGIFIVTDLPEAVGTSVEIDFLFKEDWEKIRVCGIVAWIAEKERVSKTGIKHPLGMGIEFTNPPEEFLRRIKKLYLK